LPPRIFFFSLSDFWPTTPPNANVLHVTCDVQAGRDHHAVNRFGRAHPQGRDHRRDPSRHSLDRFSGQAVQVPQSLRVTASRSISLVGLPSRPLRPFIATAITSTTLTGQKHTRARAHRARTCAFSSRLFAWFCAVSGQLLEGSASTAASTGRR